MMEEKAVARRGDFLPELPDTEVHVARGDIVQQHDASFADLRQPVVEVVAHSFVSMQAVDV